MGSAFSLEALCSSRRDGEAGSSTGSPVFIEGFCSTRDGKEIRDSMKEDDSAHLNRSVTVHEAS
jgi:hypothetical protein